MSRDDQDNTAAVSSLVMPEAWTEKGACVRALNPDAWFPERGANGNMEARLAQGPSCEGIWGGTTHAERRKMLRMGCTTLEEYKALTEPKTEEPVEAPVQPAQDMPTVEPAAPVKDKTTTFPDILSEVMQLPGNYTIGSLFSGY